MVRRQVGLLPFLPLSTPLTSISTDPTTISIVLVEQNHNPPISLTIAPNVTVSEDSFTVRPICSGAPNGAAYQVNFESENGIVAQSPQFSVTGAVKAASACAAATSTSAAPAATTPKHNSAAAIEVAAGLGAVVFGAAVFGAAAAML
jgi:hypothetical protein